MADDARGYYTGVRFAHFFLALLLVACSATSPEPTQTDAPTQQPEPTQPPGLVLLLAPEGSDAALAAAAAEAAQAYAAENGLLFEQRATLSANQIPPQLVALVALAPDPDLSQLAAAAPVARMVAVGFTPTEPAANLVSIDTGAAGSQEVAFIAGYIAALSAEDWRAGFLYTPASADLVDSFTAGAEYFCGSCAPPRPPYSEYPMAAQATSAADWQAAADQLLSQFIDVVYLAPELEGSGAAQYLAARGVLLVGSSQPPGDVAHAWLASVSASAASLQQQLAAALAGQLMPAERPLALQYTHAEQFGQSRQANVQQVIDELLSGYLVPQSVQ